MALISDTYDSRGAADFEKRHGFMALISDTYDSRGAADFEKRHGCMAFISKKGPIMIPDPFCRLLDDLFKLRALLYIPVPFPNQ